MRDASTYRANKLFDRESRRQAQLARVSDVVEVTQEQATDWRRANRRNPRFNKLPAAGLRVLSKYPKAHQGKREQARRAAIV